MNMMLHIIVPMSNFQPPVFNRFSTIWKNISHLLPWIRGKPTKFSAFEAHEISNI